MSSFLLKTRREESTPIRSECRPAEAAGRKRPPVRRAKVVPRLPRLGFPPWIPLSEAPPETKESPRGQTHPSPCLAIGHGASFGGTARATDPGPPEVTTFAKEKTQHRPPGPQAPRRRGCYSSLRKAGGWRHLLTSPVTGTEPAQREPRAHTAQAGTAAEAAVVVVVA